MTDTQLWIAATIAGAVLSVGGWALKNLAGHILKRLDRIADLLQDLQLARATHHQDIRSLREGHADHEVRIRKIEFKTITEKF